MARIFILIEEGYDTERVAYLGDDWNAVRTFISSYSAAVGMRVEEWNPPATRPVQVIHATKVERFELPEELPEEVPF